MNAKDIIEFARERVKMSYRELAEYADLGSENAVYKILHRQDLKVGTFVKLLETLGYQLVVQNMEEDTDDIVVG